MRWEVTTQGQVRAGGQSWPPLHHAGGHQGEDPAPSLCPPPAPKPSPMAGTASQVLWSLTWSPFSPEFPWGPRSPRGPCHHREQCSWNPVFLPLDPRAGPGPGGPMSTLPSPPLLTDGPGGPGRPSDPGGPWRHKGAESVTPTGVGGRSGEGTGQSVDARDVVGCPSKPAGPLSLFALASFLLPELLNRPHH